eukprot:IDg2710t1
MADSKPVVTPMERQISIEDTKGDKIDATLYRQAIGSLMYLETGTRPDIAFAVGRLAQHVENPAKELWVHVKRVLRKSTSGFVFLMAGGTVSWKSKKQGCIAHSSSEAEYITLATAVKET